MSFWSLQVDTKTNKIFYKDLCPGLKREVDSKINIGTLSFLNYLKIDQLGLFIQFNLFLEARVEILTKILLGFWSI